MGKRQESEWGPGWGGIVTALVAVILLLAFVSSRHGKVAPGETAARGSGQVVYASQPAGKTRASTVGPNRQRPSPEAAAEQIVAQKLARFSESRRALAHALARRHEVELPDEVDRFFDAVASGNWDAIEAAYNKINGGDKSVSHGSLRPPEVNEAWSAISDAYGAAEQVHLWPAQKLLDYGNALLGALRPGMVYVGGTDNGRWIPELLNDTSPGENHIVVTQNGLADGKYLEYVNELYGDRMATLTQEDSQRAFQEYLTDAQKRLEHDQKFPDEPKQVLPGENISLVDGKTQVRGQVAVMSINERLLQALMQKNPDVPFALQESFPLRGTYAEALPLGPIMELRAQDGQTEVAADRVAQSLDYWRSTTQQLLADPEAASSEATLKSYSHDAGAEANLLAAKGYFGEAEQAYRLATQIYPGNPEATAALAALLASNGQEAASQQLLDDFARKYPDQQKALAQPAATARLIFNAAVAVKP